MVGIARPAAAAVTVRVLVVEDEEVAAEAHAAYVGRVSGFESSVSPAPAATPYDCCAGARVDLVLLDMHLPDVHGLGLLQRLRQDGRILDVIAVTSARDLAVVRKAVAQGVVHYVLKPFTFAGLRGKLEQYAAYREQLGSADAEVVQDEVDQLLGLRGRPAAPSCPRG